MECLVPLCENSSEKGKGQIIECVDNWTGEKTNGFICQPCFNAILENDTWKRQNDNSQIKRNILKDYRVATIKEITNSITEKIKEIR